MKETMLSKLRELLAIRRRCQQISKQQTKGPMKKASTKTTVTALVVLTMSSLAGSLASAWAEHPPGPRIIENQRTPANRINLPNGVIKVVTSVVLNRGKWTIEGGATVQVNVDPEVEGQYLYTFAAFTTNPNVFPLDGSVGMDARPYDTWWFASEPRPHTITVPANGTVVYLIVAYYGQTSAELVQAFGNIIATMDVP